MIHDLWRQARNSPKWLLVVFALFVFVVLIQRILIPSISRQTENLLTNLLQFSLPFDISVIFLSIVTFLIWTAIALNFEDQADELDQLKRENVALREEVDRLVEGYKTDDITKIPNEMKLKSQIREFLAEHPSRGFSLIYLDVNAFKQINTRLGSAKANIILRALAWKLRHGIRREEEIFRDQSSDIYRRFVGGDEFILLIHGDEETCLYFVKRIYHELLPELSAELKDQLRLEDDFELTISAGSYTFSPSEKRQLLKEQPEDLRMALYKIMSNAERLCQSAKKSYYGTSYVWNGLVASLDQDEDQYAEFKALFPPRETNSS